MKQLALLSCVLTFFVATSVLADIHYVDADLGNPSSNTIVTGGTALTPANLGGWTPRGAGASFLGAGDASSFGNFGGVLQGVDSVGSEKELTTTISGLSAASSHEIFVFFWDDQLDPPAIDGTSSQWDIDAGLASGVLTSFSASNSTLVDAATIANISGLNVLGQDADDYTDFVDGNRTLHYASLGVVPSGTTDIDVFIRNSDLRRQRTWFDGVGYEKIPEPSEVSLYDNIPDDLPLFTSGRNNAGPPGPSQLQPLHAQPFITDQSGTVSSVSIYMIARTGAKGTVDVVLTEDGGGFPGDVVSALGTIDLETLPIWGDAPAEGKVITFSKAVEGLSPESRYFVGFDITKMENPGDRFPEGSFFNYFVTNPDGTADAGVTMVGPFGEWKPLQDFVPDGRYMLMRVTAPSPPAVELKINATDHDSVTLDPEMDFYPIGSDVMVTAAPVDGYEFIKWTYGEEEFTTNPAVITVTEGATLTPFFAEIVAPTPLNIDIAPAVAVSWNSQIGKTYQIHSSTDMENWEVAVDAVEGTGERLTHCFIRGDSEIFYRVEESP